MLLRITTGKDNPLLRKKAAQIDDVTPALHQLIADMAQTMKQADGVGIAAPQVGQNAQLFVVDSLAFDKERSKWEFKRITTPPDVTKPLAFINPVISTYPKVSEGMVEGCLSLPGWEGKVARSKRITIKAQTVKGEAFKLHAKGLLAKVLQHEYDHLQGTLICDKWENAKKVKNQKSKIKSAIQNSKITDIIFFGDSDYSKIVLNKLKGTAFEPKIIIGKTKPYTLSPKPYFFGITAAYGKIIPQEIVDTFSKGILNIHPSLLPKYRGPSPLQKAIINGDSKTGVSIALVTNKVDAGALVAQREFFIDRAYTSSELGELLFEQGARLLLEILPDYLAGKITPQGQDETNASFTHLINKQEGFINWEEDAILIERKIRAYQPWPTAHTFIERNGKIMRIQLLQARVAENLTSLEGTRTKDFQVQAKFLTGLTGENEPGTLEGKQKKLIVACGNGSLEILSLRPEGKKQMSGEEFIRGYHAQTFISNSV